MSVVVTPDARSPVLETIDVHSVVSDFQASVATWRDTDADALVVDSIDASILDDIRSAPDGPSVPLIQITNETRSDGPADAVLTPDADHEDAVEAIERAIAARDYREAVSALFEACQGRDAGHPESEIRTLRAKADAAYHDLDDIPPSALYSPDDTEQ